MAITLTVAEVSAAIRLGSSTEETAESTRLLTYVMAAISRHLGDAYEAAPEAVVNEAGIRLAGYLFDQPNAGRGLSFANAGRNSGAWTILLPFRVHRAGSTGEAVAAAQEAVGTTGNPVTNVAISGGNLVVTFDDGTTRDDPLPAGMTGGDGTDQTARDAADGAQGTADAAQADLDAHEGTPHNHDATARDAAAAAQTAADAAQADLDTHERAPHNTDGTARTAASAAQARADDAYTLADGKVDTTGAATAAREVTADWAEADNPDPIPAPKLVNVVTAHVDIANVLDGRLPGLPIAARLGWSQSRMFTELDFDRPLPPIGGSIAGMSDGLVAPPFPPGLASDPTLYLGIWLAGDPDVAELPAGFAVADKSAITVDGAAGVYFASTERLPASVAGDVFKVFLVGPRLITESDLAAHVSDPVAHHVPPAGGGPGGSDLEVSTAEIRFLRSTPIVEIDSQGFTNAAWSNLQRDGADVVCPPTGQLEFFMHSKSGLRDNSVAYAKIPAAELRATPTGGEMQVALGANRWFGIRTNSLADQHIQLKGQDGQTSVNGNYSVLMNHIEEVTATVVTQVTVGGGA